LYQLRAILLGKLAAKLTDVSTNAPEGAEGFEMSKAKTTKAKAKAERMEIEVGDTIKLIPSVAATVGRTHADVFTGRAEADYVQLQNDNTTIRVSLRGNTLELETREAINISLVNPAAK